MDYSKLSNFEINSAVSMALLDKSANPSARYVAIGDYCNNPTDAWPNIEKYRISFLDQLTEWRVDAKGVSPVFEANPLRGAMIVFLMMRESKIVPANSTGSDIR